MNIITKDLTAAEKRSISQVLHHSGKSLYNAVKELKTSQKPQEIAAIAWEIPEIKKQLNYKPLKWLIVNLCEFTPKEITKALNTLEKTFQLNLTKKPEDIENIYDWFIETHKAQIQKAIKNGTSIREIVRQFSTTYTPNAGPMYGFKPIRARINNLGINLEKKETCLEFLQKHPKLVTLLTRKAPPTQIHAEAVKLGFTGTIRTIQRTLKAFECKN
jgi:hypothetical protein